MKIQFEDLDLLVVTDGAEQYAPETFAPGMPAAQVAAVLADYQVHSSRYVLPSNILVLRHAGRVILFDAGNGYVNGPEAGKLPANLAAAGISTEDVTDILISHMHSDHTGGLFNREGLPVFPNALIHVSQPEYDGWMGDTLRHDKSKQPPAAIQAMQQRIRRGFASIGAALRLFQPGVALFDLIIPVLAAGHTPGHCMFALQRHDAILLHLSDLAHDEALLFAKPEWGTLFDTDFEQAAATRRRELHALAQSGQTAFGYHLPWPGFGRVSRRGEGFQWMPVRCPSPQWPLLL